MQPLKTEQQVLTWLCIYPAAENTGKLQKLIYVIFSLILLITISCLVVASAAFFRKFLAIDFETALNSLHPIMGWSPLIYIFMVMISLKHHVVAIFAALSDIYRKRKLKTLKLMIDQQKFLINYKKNLSSETEDDVIQYLAKVNAKCEWLWKICTNVLIGFFASNVGSCAGSVLSFILSHEQFNTENMYYQYKIMYVFVRKFKLTTNHLEF